MFNYSSFFILNKGHLISVSMPGIVEDFKSFMEGEGFSTNVFSNFPILALAMEVYFENIFITISEI